MLHPNSVLAVAAADLARTIRCLPLVGMLGWQDVRQRYRRSSLGPFWLTISTGIMIATLGIVFGTLFKTPLHDFFPFLTVGLLLWTFISTTLTEGCDGFVSAESIIKQLSLPLSLYIFRLIWRNMIILAHNLVLLPLVFMAVWAWPGWVAVLSLAGFFLLLLNLGWITLLLAVVCARYRDLTQIVVSLLTVVFYFTPIIWMPGLMEGHRQFFLIELNPVYHLIEVVRAPLIGQFPTAANWWVSISIAVTGWLCTAIFFGRYRRRVPYWL